MSRRRAGADRPDPYHWTVPDLTVCAYIPRRGECAVTTWISYPKRGPEKRRVVLPSFRWKREPQSEIELMRAAIAALESLVAARSASEPPRPAG